MQDLEDAYQAIDDYPIVCIWELKSTNRFLSKLKSKFNKSFYAKIYYGVILSPISPELINPKTQMVMIEDYGNHISVLIRSCEMAWSNSEFQFYQSFVEFENELIVKQVIDS